MILNDIEFNKLDELINKTKDPMKTKRALVYYHVSNLIGNNKQHWDKWLNSYNDHLKSIPSELIKTTEGYLEVITYLQSVANR